MVTFTKLLKAISKRAELANFRNDSTEKDRVRFMFEDIREVWLEAENMEDE